SVRRKAREVIGAERFIEVHLNAPIEVCRARDKTGAFELADQGKMPQFPGVSTDYEPPTRADLTLPTHELSVEQSVDRIMALMKERKLIP
ncbi:MAG: adenylyl-sulfate kinase, partial [Tepidisphaeraceae bacterium]